MPLLLNSYYIAFPLFRPILFLVMFSGLLLSCTPNSDLVKEGKSNYHIFVSEQAATPEKNAAIILQKYLNQMTGVTLPIRHDIGNGKDIICIGFKEAPAVLLKQTDTTSFSNEEFLIRSDGQTLLIAGGGSRGTIYGVMAYLTDHLGFRWYTREVTRIPANPTLSLTRIEDRQRPALEYREPYYQEAYHTEWALFNKTNSMAIPDSLGGAYRIFPFVHTFDHLVPPALYFDKHPEYFAEVDGKRSKSQLCLTNTDVVGIAIATTFDWIATHPNTTVFTVDQNDFGGNCTCTHCKALDDREGSPAGSLLHFVNQIADTVGKVHPEITIQTLAYDYTEAPPKTIRPADNVTIRLCHYAYCSAHPLGGCNNHKPYIERLEKWKKIAKRVTIWDYYTQFASYLMPFPNLETVKNDVKFYADHGVIGLFAQGNRVPDDGNGEFSELRAWLFSQLMWNPHQDAQALVDEFVQAVYGPAAPYIDTYIRLLHDQVKPDSVYFSIWTNPQDVNYLNLPTIQKADSLFDLAKQVAQKDPALLKRVERAYLPILFTKLYFHSIGGIAYTAGQMPQIKADFERIIADNRITSMAEVPEVGSIPAFLASVDSKNKFMIDWWTIGPFDNTNREGFDRIYGPETEFDSTKTYQGVAGRQVGWTKHSDPTSGYIDFAKMFRPKDDVVAYAFRKIHLPEDRFVKLGVGSNDGVKVWVNGQLVARKFSSRAAIPNEDQLTVSMKKGENTLLVKVDQMGNKWGFYLTEMNEQMK